MNKTKGTLVHNAAYGFVNSVFNSYWKLTTYIKPRFWPYGDIKKGLAAFNCAKPSESQNYKVGSYISAIWDQRLGRCRKRVWQHISTVPNLSEPQNS